MNIDDHEVLRTDKITEINYDNVSLCLSNDVHYSFGEDPSSLTDLRPMGQVSNLILANMNQKAGK